MSNITRAVIPIEKLTDRDCVLEALKNLNFTYIKKGNRLHLNNGLQLEELQNGFRIIYYYEDYNKQEKKTNAVKFAKNLVKEYDRLFQEKLEKIKYQEMKLKESMIIADIEEQRELKKKEAILKKERIRLEMIKKREEMERKKQIEEKIKKLKTKAEQLGYSIQERMRGNERILVLVRRR